MAGRPTSTFTDLELKFMQLFWEYGSLETDSIQSHLEMLDHPLSDGSIRKILSILMKKGYVSREKSGRGFVYSPTIQRDQAQGTMVKEMIHKAFQGSASQLVASLLDHEEITDKELEQIKAMIAKHETRGRS